MLEFSWLRYRLNYFWFLIANVDTDFVHHLCRMRIETPRRFGHVKTVEDERIKLAIIAANNHYAGFGPGTANVFRKMLRITRSQVARQEEGQEYEQRHLITTYGFQFLEFNH